MKYSLSNLKKAIYKELRRGEMYSVHYANKIVAESIWNKDPYGWSENADATISCESGIPSYMEFSFWENVNKSLEHCCLIEPVNGGVMSVYADPTLEQKL